MSLWLFIVNKIGGAAISDMTKRMMTRASKIKFLPLGFLAKKAYYLSMTETLKNMPFVYKDLEVSEVFKDFQEIMVSIVPRRRKEESDYEYLKFNWIDFNPAKSQNLFATRIFKEHRKILIMGSPGIGKSTLMRYATLIAITKPKEANFANSKNYVPVFIPLSLVSSADTSPIINYILNEVEYFGGKKGQKRLLDLARTKRLLLILDGYDEINDSELTTNYARSEMSLLFSSNISSEDIRNAKINEIYTEIYKGLIGCPVWLSTRTDFYDRLPLKTYDVPDKHVGEGNIYDREFAAVGLLGLNTRRQAFVEKIFGKYKDRGLQYENLNAELFIKDIERNNDEKILELSKIPLFLTIMCYLHIKNLEGSYNKSLLSADLTEDLILSCISALLWEIDLNKTRNMTEKQRAAFVDRRSGYFQEKKEFLNYFAFCLYGEDKMGFSEDYIKDKAKDFFSQKSSSPNKDLIMKGLTSKNHGYRDLVEQLVQSEIFNAISIGNFNKVYDFRHRRFREVLAKNYIVEQDGLEELLTRLSNRNLSEILSLVYDGMPGFRHQIIDRILDLLQTEHFAYANDLLYGLMKEKENTFNLAPLLQEKIKIWIYENTCVKINGQNLEYCEFDKEFLNWLGEEVLGTDRFISNINSIAFAYSLLKHLKEPATRKIVDKKLSNDHPVGFPRLSILFAHYQLSEKIPTEYKQLRGVLHKIPTTILNGLICKIMFFDKRARAVIFDQNKDLLKEDLNNYLKSDVPLLEILSVLGIARRFSYFALQDPKENVYLKFYTDLFYLIDTTPWEGKANAIPHKKFKEDYQLKEGERYPLTSTNFEEKGHWDSIQFFNQQFRLYDEMSQQEYDKAKGAIQSIKDDTLEFMSAGIT